jgi:23S rRNA (uridine2552-2'-O)-methyltransferase
MYKHKDHYWRLAKKEGYRSRAAYKLMEIQKRNQIFRKGDRVLDLGSAPGGWLQVIASEVGPAGRVLGVDLLRVTPLPFKWVGLLRGDIREPSFQEKVRDGLGEEVRIVTSDMSPDITGIGFQDHVRSCALVREAMGFSRGLLAPGGIFLAKLFQGEESEGLKKELARSFQKTKWVLPASSRKRSSEIYLLGTGFDPGSDDPVAGE